MKTLVLFNQYKYQRPLMISNIKNQNMFLNYLKYAEEQSKNIRNKSNKTSIRRKLLHGHISKDKTAHKNK